MSLVIKCSGCKTGIRAKEEYRGKRVKCPKCQGPIDIPTAEQSSATVSRAATLREPAAPVAPNLSVPATGGRNGAVSAPSPATRDGQPAGKAKPTITPRPVDPKLIHQRIMFGFQGEIQPIPLPFSYVLALVAVTLVMLLLVLAYVLLIGLVAFGVYYHLVNHTGIIGAAGGGRAVIFAIAVYVAPLLVGTVLLLFMVKPIFARSGKPRAPRSLTREREPLLFEFVDRVCDAIGSPKPRRIDVDCDVNASAGLRRGLLSMIGSDLVLTIGLPLAAGLSLRQFAGVLGHEFGHFTQGAGMRLTYFGRKLNYWFGRVVYERDQWDQQLVDWSRNADIRIAVFLWMAQGCVWLTRRILWLLMMIGHGVSGFMLRQMEFDADLCETRLAGSDTFESTCRRLRVLGLATNKSYSDLHSYSQDGRLVNDLPRLIQHNASQMPADVMATLNEAVDNSKTGWFDTHPADKERIAAALQENATGVFRLDMPASVLFADFPALCRTATFDYYQMIFGQRFRLSDMYPIEDLLSRQKREQDARTALRRFFQGVFNAVRPLPVSAWVEAPANPKQSLETLQRSRRAIVAGAATARQQLKSWDSADTILFQSEQAKAYRRAGLKFKPDVFDVPMVTSEQTVQARQRAQDRQLKANATLGPFEEAAGARLMAAVQLLHAPQLAKKLPDAESLRDEAGELLTAVSLINRHMPALVEFQSQHGVLTGLVAQIERHKENKDFLGEVVDQMKRNARELREFHGSFAVVNFPLEHAKGEMTLSAYCIPNLPGSDDLQGCYTAGQQMLETAFTLYARLVGRLAATAEKVETALGLPLLPDPKDEDDKKDSVAEPIAVATG